LRPSIRGLLIVAVSLGIGAALSWDLISEAVRGPRPRSMSDGFSARPAMNGIDSRLATEGGRIFAAQCAACHGPHGDWPITARLKGRTRDDFYALLDHLPTVNPVMPAFTGTDDERRALSEYLGSLGGNKDGDQR
jgi:mono/diheme cytochrome c family protein